MLAGLWQYEYGKYDKRGQLFYGNALFKGRSKLFSYGEHDFGAEFLELEQSNGQIVYVSRFSVVSFCEHGVDVVGENIPPG